MKDVKCFLENYLTYKKLIENKNKEIQLLQDAEDMERVKVLNQNINFLKSAMIKIEQVIDGNLFYNQKITEQKYSQEQLFLHYRYIIGMTLEETAREMHVSRDTVYRTKNKALTMIANRL